MSIEEYVHGKVSPIENKKTGELDLSIEAAKLITGAIRRTGLEKERNIFDDGKRTAEINVQEQMRAGLNNKESYASLFKGFSLDISNIRKKVAKYVDMTDIAMKNAAADDIIYSAQIIKSEILKQIEISKDPNEKADFANLEFELNSITKNVIDSSSDKAVVNG